MMVSLLPATYPNTGPASTSTTNGPSMEVACPTNTYSSPSFSQWAVTAIMALPSGKSNGLGLELDRLHHQPGRSLLLESWNVTGKSASHFTLVLLASRVNRRIFVFPVHAGVVGKGGSQASGLHLVKLGFWQPPYTSSDMLPS